MFVFSLSNILKVVLLCKKYNLKRRRFIMLNIFPPCFMKQKRRREEQRKYIKLEKFFKNRFKKISIAEIHI